MIIGYARVSTGEQATQAQEMGLRVANCDLIVEEHGSGASRSRPALSKLLRDIGPGDTIDTATPQGIFSLQVLGAVRNWSARSSPNARKPASEPQRQKGDFPATLVFAIEVRRPWRR